jgi:hypothetical protein
VVRYFLTLHDFSSASTAFDEMGPLHVACAAAHLPIVRPLIEEGGYDVDCRQG